MRSFIFPSCALCSRRCKWGKPQGTQGSSLPDSLGENPVTNESSGFQSRYEPKGLSFLQGRSVTAKEQMSAAGQKRLDTSGPSRPPAWAPPAELLSVR